MPNHLLSLRNALVPLVATAILSGICVLPAMAAVTTITFDAGDPIGGLAVGTTLSNQYAAFGVTFTPNGFTGSGAPTGNWATNSNMTIVNSGNGGDVGGLGTPSLVSGNVLRSFNGWLGENGDPSFRATFSTPVTEFSAAFAGVASPNSVRIFAFNGVTLVDSITAVNIGQSILSVSAPTITSVVVTPGDFNDWVGVDNISFNTSAVTVPEPSTVALFASALAGGVLVLRRRKN